MIRIVIIGPPPPHHHPFVIQVPDFQKFPILVSASRAEKNYLAKKEGATGKTASAARPAAPGPNQNRVYIGNLHVSLTEADLKV